MENKEIEESIQEEFRDWAFEQWVSEQCSSETENES